MPSLFIGALRRLKASCFNAGLRVDFFLPALALISAYPVLPILHPAPSAVAKKPIIIPIPVVAATEWAGYGGGYTHQALSTVAAQNLTHILWSTPVDAQNYNGNEILAHYGEAAVTPSNNLVVPLRPTSGGSYTVRGLKGATGALIWSWTSTFIEPSHDWVPSFGPALLPSLQQVFSPVGSNVNPFPTKVAWPESGGRIAIRTDADTTNASVTAWTFYGNSEYAAHSAAYDAGLKICTPLTAGPDGSVYFGYVVESAIPNGLQNGGIAVIHPNGTSGFIPAAQLSGDSGTPFITLNCAPALSPDGSKVYVEASSTASGWGRGYLCSITASNFTPLAKVALMDVNNPSNWALTTGDSTASPMVGPDGDVYMGVLENPFLSNDDRGWMLHFSGDLRTRKTPGAFGWDDTASVVPASAVHSYSGQSKYLICTKYNDYADFGSQPGNNKVAILDPNSTEVDSISGATTMKEVMTVVGPTFNTELGVGVREWCVNSVAIDPISKCAILNSEDGWAYRWDLTTGTITQRMQLSSGIGEAYTPTIIGPNGVVYCVNNAIIYAIGVSP